MALCVRVGIITRADREVPFLMIEFELALGLEFLRVNFRIRRARCPPVRLIEAALHAEIFASVVAIALPAVVALAVVSRVREVGAHQMADRFALQAQRLGKEGNTSEAIRVAKVASELSPSNAFAGATY